MIIRFVLVFVSMAISLLSAYSTASSLDAGDFFNIFFSIFFLTFLLAMNDISSIRILRLNTLRYEDLAEFRNKLITTQQEELQQQYEIIKNYRMKNAKNLDNLRKT